MGNMGTASGTGISHAAAMADLVSTVNGGGGIDFANQVIMGVECSKNEVTGQWTCILALQVS